MLESIVKSIAIAESGKEKMEEILAVRAIAGKGLEGDRYANGVGSFQKPEKPGNRQVTIIDARFLSCEWPLPLTRRNIAVDGAIDLMRLIRSDKKVEFQIGEAVLRAHNYCDPCNLPSKLAGRSESFQEAFWGHGGIVAEVLTTGMIRVGDVMSAKVPKR